MRVINISPYLIFTCCRLYLYSLMGNILCNINIPPVLYASFIYLNIMIKRRTNERRKIMTRKLFLVILIIAFAGAAALLLTHQGVSATPQLGCKPAVFTVKTGQIFYYTVAVTDTTDVYAWQFDMSYNPTYLEFIGAYPGDHLRSDSAGNYFVQPVVTSNEVQLVANTRLSKNVGINGSGYLAHLYFRAKKATTGVNSTINDHMIVNRNALNVTYSSYNSFRCKVIISDSAPIYVQPPVGFLTNMPVIIKSP